VRGGEECICRDHFAWPPLSFLIICEIVCICERSGVANSTNSHFIGMESQFEGKQKFDKLKNKQLTTVIFGDKMRTQNKSKLFCVLAVQLFIHTCICFKYPVRDKSAYINSYILK
jgi:hypothetical protein